MSVVTSSEVTHIQRPRPMPDLSPEAKEIWREVVNRLPAEWFPAETWPLLSSYCAHAVQARRVRMLLERCTAGKQLDLDDYERLLRMQERESRAMTALARSMRLTQASTYDREKRKPTITQAPPWD